MKHRAGVIRPGETAAAEGHRLHPEIAAVFLHHEVGRDFRGPEQAVGAVVDRHRLVDAEFREGMRGIELPSRVLLDQGQHVGGVAIDLVGGGEDEDGIGTMPPCRFQQNHRAGCVDGKVCERLAGGPVVRGLGGGMNHHGDILAVPPEHFGYGRLIANIDMNMSIGRQRLLKVDAGRLRGCGWTEEVAAHVVIDTHDIEAFVREQAAGLRADQSRGSGDEGNAHGTARIMRERPQSIMRSRDRLQRCTAFDRALSIVS
jgi:hypothetical protein